MEELAAMMSKYLARLRSKLSCRQYSVPGDKSALFNDLSNATVLSLQLCERVGARVETVRDGFSVQITSLLPLPKSTKLANSS